MDLNPYTYVHGILMTHSNGLLCLFRYSCFVLVTWACADFRSCSGIATPVENSLWLCVAELKFLDFHG